jgi:hypothetical protein
VSKRRLIALALAAWLLGLGFMLQPHPVEPPRILHTRPLDAPDRDLPTLAPLHP